MSSCGPWWVATARVRAGRVSRRRVRQRCRPGRAVCARRVDQHRAAPVGEELVVVAAPGRLRPVRGDRGARAGPRGGVPVEASSAATTARTAGTGWAGRVVVTASVVRRGPSRARSEVIAARVSASCSSSRSRWATTMSSRRPSSLAARSSRSSAVGSPRSRNRRTAWASGPARGCTTVAGDRVDHGRDQQPAVVVATQPAEAEIGDPGGLADASPSSTVPIIADVTAGSVAPPPGRPR